MNTFLQGFLDNDSFFGRFMTKLGIIIAANLMFIVFSLPFFTIGAGLVALYHVMFRTLRNGGVVNPFKEFWAGFKSNFKQGTIAWLIFIALIGFLTVDLQICEQAGGAIGSLRFAIYAIGAAIVFLYLYLLPTMAAFADTLPHLLRDALYFLVKKPWKFVVIAFFDVFPLILTYTDLKDLPLYAFIWVLCGFGLQAMLGATLLLPLFAPHLEEVDPQNDAFVDPTEDEEAALDDLRELDGL
ncbi:MAG: YesL family protein [Mogibacterium sp.]|nr:YesL family protein [Mogibacterium sp.]